MVVKTQMAQSTEGCEHSGWGLLMNKVKETTNKKIRILHRYQSVAIIPTTVNISSGSETLTVMWVNIDSLIKQNRPGFKSPFAQNAAS